MADIDNKYERVADGLEACAKYTGVPRGDKSIMENAVALLREVASNDRAAMGRVIAVEYWPHSKKVRRVAFELNGEVTQLYSQP